MHPFDLLPSSTCGFQVLKVKQCISADVAGPTKCAARMVKYSCVIQMFCKANRVQKVDESVRWPHSLAIWLFAIEFSQSFLKCSYYKSLGFHQRYNPSECGFGSVVWYDLSLSLLCVIKVALSAKASAVLLYAVSQWPGIHCKKQLSYSLS